MIRCRARCVGRRVVAGALLAVVIALTVQSASANGPPPIYGHKVAGVAGYKVGVEYCWDNKPPETCHYVRPILPVDITHSG